MHETDLGLGNTKLFKYMLCFCITVVLFFLDVRDSYYITCAQRAI